MMTDRFCRRSGVFFFFFLFPAVRGVLLHLHGGDPPQKVVVVTRVMFHDSSDVCDGISFSRCSPQGLVVRIVVAVSPYPALFSFLGFIFSFPSSLSRSLSCFCPKCFGSAPVCGDLDPTRSDPPGPKKKVGTDTCRKGYERARGGTLLWVPIDAPPWGANIGC